MNSKVDEYLNNVGKWQKELEQLRTFNLLDKSDLPVFVEQIERSQLF